MIAGLLLAAGRSRRFGSDKLTAKLKGKAVVRHSIGALAGLEDIYVVIPPGADGIVQALSRIDVRFVINLAHAEGMGSSIRAGVAALPDHVEAVVIALGDQPLASPDVTRRVIERWHEGDADAVVPQFRESMRGHPVLFGRSCFAALRELRGDAGARAVLGAVPCLGIVEVDADVPADVDTPDVLQSLERANDHSSH